MKKFLFVMRDIMSARSMLSVIRLLKELGHEVCIIAEGKAVGICKEAGLGFIVPPGGDEIRPFGTESDDIALLIDETIKPDVVCIGCSVPINWELAFAKSAQQMQYPVVAFADIWGAGSRLQGFRPDLMVVIDKLAVDFEFGRSKKFAIIGDPAEEIYRKCHNAPADDATLGHLARLDSYCGRGIKTVLVVGDNNKIVVDICRTTAACIHETNHLERYLLIPRLVHPNFVNDPRVRTIVMEAMAQFEGIAVDDFTEGGRASTDWLAAHCDYTFTSYSTCGRVALHSGSRFVSVQTESCKQSMWDETGLPVFPLYDSSTVPTVRSGVNIEKLPWRGYDGAARSWAKQSQFRPQVAVDAILDLV